MNIISLPGRPLVIRKQKQSKTQSEVDYLYYMFGISSMWCMYSTRHTILVYIVWTKTCINCHNGKRKYRNDMIFPETLLTTLTSRWKRVPDVLVLSLSTIRKFTFKKYNPILVIHCCLLMFIESKSKKYFYEWYRAM